MVVALTPEIYDRDLDLPVQVFHPIRRFARFLVNSLRHDGYYTALKRFKCLCDWYEYYSLGPKVGVKPDIERGVPTILLNGETWVILPGVRHQRVGVSKYLLPPAVAMHEGRSGEWSRHCCYQFKLCKRALPPAPPEAYLDSAIKFKRTVTTYVDYPPELDELARQFGKAVAEKLPIATWKKKCHTTLSSSSCYESSRKKGGLMGHFLRLKARGKRIFEASSAQGLTGDETDAFGRPIITDGMVETMGMERRELIDYLSFEQLFSFPDVDYINLVPWMIAAEMARMRHLPPNAWLLSEWKGVERPFDAHFFSEDPISYPAKYGVVLDSGGKARTITVPPAAITLLLHYLRTEIVTRLASVRSITSLGAHEGTASRKLIGVNSHEELREDEYFMSLDLSSATDTFPTEFCRNLLYGFLEAVNFEGRDAEKRLCYFAARFACGTCVLTPLEIYISKERMEAEGLMQFESERAIFMGTPTSWCLLNLTLMFINFFADEVVRSRVFIPGHSGPQPTIPSNTVLEGGYQSSHVKMWALVLQDIFSKGVDIDLRHFETSVELCGDDMMARVIEPFYHAYCHILGAMGMILSSGTGLSKHAAIFTEKHYTVKGRLLWYDDCIRAKSLVDNRIGLRGSGVDPTIPSYVTRGVAATAALDVLRYMDEHDFATCMRKAYKACCWLVIHANRTFITTLRKLAIPVYLARVFGGAEFPFYNGVEASFRHERTMHRLAAGYMIRSDTTVQGALMRFKLASIWVPPRATTNECSKLMDAWFSYVLDPAREMLHLLDDRVTSAGTVCWIPGHKVWEQICFEQGLGLSEFKSKVSARPRLLDLWLKNYNLIPLGDAARRREADFRYSVYSTITEEDVLIEAREFHLSHVSKRYASILRKFLPEIRRVSFDIKDLSEEELIRLSWWSTRSIFVRPETITGQW